jgi:hypothetical protein
MADGYSRLRLWGPEALGSLEQGLMALGARGTGEFGIGELGHWGVFFSRWTRSAQRTYNSAGGNLLTRTAGSPPRELPSRGGGRQ